MLRRALAFAVASFVCAGSAADAATWGSQADVPAHLYIAEQTTTGGAVGQIAVFPLNARGNVAPQYIIAGPHTGILYPQSVNFDERGNVYVYDEGGIRVAIAFWSLPVAHTVM